MKRFIRISLVLLFSGLFSFSKSQNSLRYFHADSLKAIVNFLAADSLKGRQNFSPSLEQAAVYIAEHFRNARLELYDKNPSYLQPFIPPSFRIKQKEEVTLNGNFHEPSAYFFFSSFHIVPNIDPVDFKIIASRASKADELVKTINKQLDSATAPLLVLIPSVNKSWIKSFKTQQFIKPKHSLLIIAIDEVNPSVYVNISREVRSKILFNVVGVQKGKRFHMKSF